jgi:hypothetical protein
LAETLEQRARTGMERLREAAGWLVQDYQQAQIHAARGVTIRTFSLNPGFAEADSLSSGRSCGLSGFRAQCSLTHKWPLVDI